MQTQCSLHCLNEGGEDTFCCLGVLRNERTGFGPNDRNGYLDDEELSAVGLSRKQMSTLVTLNDVYEWSFRRIANWIERYVPEE